MTRKLFTDGATVVHFEAAIEAAIEAPEPPVPAALDDSAWQLKQEVLKPLIAENLAKGLALMAKAEAAIDVGDVDRGGAYQTLASHYIHLV